MSKVQGYYFIIGYWLLGIGSSLYSEPEGLALGRILPFKILPLVFRTLRKEPGAWG